MYFLFVKLIHNINVCEQLAAMVKTTLGPRGLDKLIGGERSTTITNDGATIIRLLNPEEPVARSLADIALSQDSEVFLEIFIQFGIDRGWNNISYAVCCLIFKSGQAVC
jgi:hypothetical protein